MNKSLINALAFVFTFTFGACLGDDDNGKDPNRDWEIALEIDLPEAQDVVLDAFFRQEGTSYDKWQEPIFDWGDGESADPSHPAHSYAAGKYTITIQGNGWIGLYCTNIHLVSFNTNLCTSLDFLDVSHNDLTELYFGEQEELANLNCDSNNISKLDISACPQLKTLSCAYNSIDSLDITRNLYLGKLYCNDNNLKAIKIGTLFDLEYVAIHNNPLSDEACNAIFNALPAKSADAPGTILLDPDKGDVSILEAKNWIPTYPSNDSNVDTAN